MNCEEDSSFLVTENSCSFFFCSNENVSKSLKLHFSLKISRESY